ncbi:MAG: hypothetical protein HG422_06975 [Prevotella sp.]|nr:hypothetical protein [Prevotella sp.]
MKKFLLFLFVLLSTEVVLAQTPSPFLVPTAEGVPLYFQVTDAVNKKVEVVSKPGLNYNDPATRVHYDKVIIPSTVMHDGVTYNVDKIARLVSMEIDSLYIPDDCKLSYQCFANFKLKRLILPKNLIVFPNNCLWALYVANGDIEEVWVNSKLKRIESFSTWCVGWSIKRFRGFVASNIEEIQNMSFNVMPTATDLINDLSILPQTIRVIDNGAFFPALPLDKLTIPLSMENLGGGNYDISGDVYISHTSPFTFGSNAFGTQSTLKVHVPVDRSFAFKPETGWSEYTDKIVEDINIGPHGYTSFYLENENFEVPAGCTAYIIKSVTQQGSANLGKTTEAAFTAGSVIPKQTGFILKGTAGSTVSYRAALTGATEVDVTGNLLVGTATEQEFSGAGYKYYLFGYGAKGQGFYHQTGREGNSIKLPAHRAGLKLSTSDFAPAKELIFNFDDAAATGISTVKPEAEKKADVIYDLQGRRVVNPSHGIYIVNRKKVVISK